MISRLVVLDVDPRNGGDASLSKLEDEVCQLPGTMVIETGSGLHIYFQHPGGTIRSRQLAGYPGIDVKGDGGIVTAPPSTHISGRRYRFLEHPFHQRSDAHSLDAIVAPIPEGIVALLNPPRRIPRHSMSLPSKSFGDWTRYGQVALSREYLRVRGAVPGTRNSALNSASFSLGQLVAANQVDQYLVEQILMQAALDAGLDAAEATRTLESGLVAGMRNPRAESAAITQPRRDQSGSGVGTSSCAAQQRWREKET